VQNADDHDARKIDVAAGMALAYKKLHRLTTQPITTARRSSCAGSRGASARASWRCAGQFSEPLRRAGEAERRRSRCIARALAVFEKALPPDDAHLITCRANLAPSWISWAI